MSLNSCIQFYILLHFIFKWFNTAKDELKIRQNQINCKGKSFSFIFFDASLVKAVHYEIRSVIVQNNVNEIKRGENE